MLSLKLAAGVLNQTPLDWEGNDRRIRAAIQAARGQGVAVLCLPELCITGYGCEDAFYAQHVVDEAWARLVALLPETRGIAVTVGLPVRYRGATWSCAAMIADGEILGLVAKQFLAGEGVHYEPRWFKPWPAGKRGVVRRNGRAVPIGDLHFDLDGVRIGFEICEDAWVADRPGATSAARALDILCNPSASHFAFGKLRVRQRLIQEGSRAFGVTYLYANLLGNEAGRVVYDGGAQIATGGEIVAAGRRFGFEAWSLVFATVDVEHTRTLQARTTTSEPELTDPDPACVATAWAPPRAPWRRPEPLAPERWETGPSLKSEEFLRAVTLGLFDYLRKTRARGYVVSLSGGADSAACACLVRLMVERGLAELGPGGFAERLGIAGEAGDDAAAWTRRLLACVYQSTAQSSETTLSAARGVAEAIGAEWLHFDVEGLVQAYVGMVGGGVGRPLGWATDDLALQNVQARVRGPGVWLLANLRGAILLTTSNRSEAAVGYATMDGDTCGGLAPIGGIDKAALRRWLVWLEQQGPEGLGPIPALRAVNVQAPTAELRPADRHQTDESDLMPYPVLDAIERAAIRDKRSPVECVDVLNGDFPEVERSQLVAWVRRFFRLWAQNQWKRERYAPSFHLDDESLDPRTWCRFPILSGGYGFELDELDRAEARGGGGGGGAAR